MPVLSDVRDVPRLPAEATTPRRTTRALEVRLGANCARVVGIAAAKVMAAMIGRFLGDEGRVRTLGLKTKRYLSFSRSVVSTEPLGRRGHGDRGEKIRGARRERAHETRGLHALLNGVAYKSYAGVTDVSSRDRSRRLFGQQKQLKILNRGSRIAKVEGEPGTDGHRSLFRDPEPTVY